MLGRGKVTQVPLATGKAFNICLRKLSYVYIISKPHAVSAVKDVAF